MSKVKFISIVVLLLVVLVQPTIALADTFTSSLQQAINLYKKGKYEQASQDMNKARMELQNTAPFSITVFHLITEEAKGYGRYTPRATSVYKAGETVHLYMETFGFTIEKKDEFYQVNLTLEIVLRDSEGDIVGRKGFNYTPQTRSFNDQFFLFFDATIGRPGKYTIEVIVTDSYANQKATTDIGIEVTGKPSSGWFW